MRKHHILFFALIILVSFFSCKKDEEEPDPDISDTTDGYAHEEPGDYEWDESTVILITLNGTTIASQGSGVQITGNMAVINTEGNYKLSGTLTDGQIIIHADTNSVIRLILDNCSISNSAGPAILIEKSKKTIVHLPARSVNSLSDGTSYSNPDADPNATLYSKSDLTIFGEGTLNVNGRYKDGISGKDGFIIKSGVLHVNAVDDGICGKDYLIIRDGNVSVNCGGDGLRSDDASNYAVGYILIDKGKFTITSGSDGITAQNYLTINGGKFNILSGGGSTILPGELSSKGLKGLSSIKLAADSCEVNSSDNALHSDKLIEVNTGYYELSSAKNGIHADESVTFDEAELRILTSDEGVESKYITVNNGQVIVKSSDDSFNATAGQSTENDDQSCVFINGGFIVLDGSDGDPLDSNGSIIMKGGTVLIHGPMSAPEVAIDYNGKFDISGGFLIASGTNSQMTIPPSESSTQNSVKMTFSTLHPDGTLFHIQDDQGTNLITFKPQRDYQSIIFSSPQLQSGKTYRIFVSGSVTGTDLFGFFEEGTYSPGNELTSFTVTETVTVLNNI